MNKKFTKNDLKDGMVIEQRNGFKGIIIGDKVVGIDCTNRLKRYTKDLCWISYTDQKPRTYDVVKVYQPKDPFISLKIYKQLFDKNKLKWFTVIWERKEKKDIKLTTEERAFLNSILLVSDYKYIARDHEDSRFGPQLFVYKTKPENKLPWWAQNDFYAYGETLPLRYWSTNVGDTQEITDQTKDMFEFITFEDGPYLIEDLLKL